MKTYQINITNYKDTSLYESVQELLFEKFKLKYPCLKEDKLNDKFYNEVVAKIFEYGEYLNAQIEIDENLNIVGGKIIPCSDINLSIDFNS